MHAMCVHVAGANKPRLGLNLYLRFARLTNDLAAIGQMLPCSSAGNTTRTFVKCRKVSRRAARPQVPGLVGIAFGGSA